MKHKLIISFLFFIVVTAIAEPPPEIEWEKTFGLTFYDILETNAGNYLVGDSDTLFLIDSSGEIIRFTTSSEIGWHYLKFQVLLLLSDGGYILTGVGKESVESSYSIPIIRLTANGDFLWSKSYGYNEYTEYAYDATELPDGGYAFAARKGAQAWILRTDSEGDTLWTREWGWDHSDQAVKIFHINNGLTVLIHGSTSSTPCGPHLVRYNMDGDLLWETYIDYPHSGPGPFARSMCLAGDGGYYIVIGGMGSPPIVHIDSEGNVIWPTDEIDFLPQTSKDMNYSDRLGISSTMDGGYIYCGEYMCEGPGPYYVDYGWIYRDNWDGSRLWSDNINYSTQGCVAINSVIQLSQGGYIGAGEAFSTENGQQGFLIKYAPELGIKNSDYSSVVTINSITPNPLSSSATIQFSLVEAGTAKLTLYDLNGREIDTISKGFFAGGVNTVAWNPPERLSSGYYLMRIETTDGCDVQSCIVMN